jgi:hypothetical protein
VNKRIYSRLAFIFLTLGIVSAVFRQSLDITNFTATIACNILLILCVIWSIPVIYPSLSSKQFALSSSCCGMGGFLYQVTIHWSSNLFILLSMLIILCAVGISNLVYLRIERV